MGLLSAVEVAALVGISRHSVNKAARVGRLRQSGTGPRGSRLFHPSDVKLFAATRSVVSADASRRKSTTRAEDRRRRRGELANLSDLALVRLDASRAETLARES